MAISTGNDGALAQRANLNIASAVVAKLGTGASDGLIGQVIDQVRATHSIAELASANGMAVVVGAVDTAIARNSEINRPRNDFSAEAARAAQAAGGADGLRGGAGFGYIEAMRGNSSARYREMASDSVKGVGGTGSSGLSGNGGAVTAEFARSFAGTGMVGGTLRTFAEVGLDRGTFNEFRKEGFSAAQIADSASDSKALGWKGKEDLSIAQHAAPETRKSFIAVEQAKTPEQIAAAQAREAAEKRRIDALPDGDPRKADAQRFYNRAIETSKHPERHQAIGTGAKQTDAVVAQDHADKAKIPDRAAQDAQAAKFKNQTSASVEANNQDDFGTTAAPAITPSKPAPVKTTAAKPPAGPKPS